jgi:carbamoyltransferase
MVLDGRGERGSFLADHVRDGHLETLAHCDLPNSLGLLYEELTEHLGYRRNSNEYKVMALASYGSPRHLHRFRELVRTDGSGAFVTEAVDWEAYAPRVGATAPSTQLTPTWPPPCRSAFRRSSWNWRAGCTTTPASGPSPWPVASP